ncbi:hypothetical protein HDU76_003983 [Blyttiomyces sp. JEL0837]|nr:hypothetical protein HDU76_003983 [Blyttiomyces sp. JEL0837]
MSDHSNNNNKNLAPHQSSSSTSTSPAVRTTTTRTPVPPASTSTSNRNPHQLLQPLPQHTRQRTQSTSASSMTSTSTDTETSSVDFDEGFDEGWADEYPLYSRSSGEQKISLATLDRYTEWVKSQSLLDDEEEEKDEKAVSDNEEQLEEQAPADLATDSSAQQQSQDIPKTTHLTTSKSMPSILPDRDLQKQQSTKEVNPRHSIATTHHHQHHHKRHATEPDYTQLEPGSQRNKDSVLHYFVATQESEKDLDVYLSEIIKVFLDTPTTINATTLEDPSITRSRFNAFKVPNQGDPTNTLSTYLTTLKQNVIEKATRVSSSKMIGHMTSALPYFHRPLARLLTAMNQNVVKLETAATMTYLERQTIAMLHCEFYSFQNNFYDSYMHSFDKSLGVFTSGGTIANITAIWAARNKALCSKTDSEGNVLFKGVEKEGLYKALQFYGYTGAVILGSGLMHYSFKKAADLIGLGDEGVVLVPTDDGFKMKVDVLERRVKEFVEKKVLVVAIVGIAGATETGSIDNLAAIADIAQRYKIHFHVDAAWGGPLIFSREHKPKLKGIHLADTITVDGHKQLYTPMGLGLVLFKSPDLASHIRKTAYYVIRHDSPDLGKFTLEGSRPAISLHLHASLHLLGKEGIESLVTRSATLVRQFSARLESHPSKCFQVLHFPETNILLYRYVPADLKDKVAARAPLSFEEDERIGEVTRRVQGRQAKEGVAGFVSRTKVRVVRGSASGSRSRTTSVEAELNGSNGGSPRGSPKLTRRNDSNSNLNWNDLDDEGVWGRWVDAFRVVIANPLTKWEDLEGVISEQILLGRLVEEEMEMERPPGEPKVKVKMWIGWPYDL